MGKGKDEPQAKRRPRFAGGLSLQKFSKAKTSGYDKREKLSKMRSLKQRTLQKYRKLQAKLRKQGRLQPTNFEEPDEDVAEQRGPDREAERALARAGPAPGDDQDSSDAVGEASSESESSAGSEAAEPPLDRPEEPVQQQRAPVGREEDSADGEAPREATPPGKRKRKPKPPSQVQLIARKVQAEKDEKAAAKAKARQEAQARQQRVAEGEKRRKQKRELYLKKTRRGQPVMKHRIDNILTKLEAEQG